MDTSFSIIVAASENNVIGKEGDLPWLLPDDMKYFKNTTLNHAVIMGRKTFESFGSKALPKRTNIVISRKPKESDPDNNLYWVESIEQALQIAQNHGEDEAFIIGGGNIYAQALPYCSKVYITRIHTSIQGDTIFPELSEEDWFLRWQQYHPKDEKHTYDFTFRLFERKD